MPFYCDIRFDETHIGRATGMPASLDAWLVSEEQWLAQETAIALLTIEGEQVELRIRFRCLVGRLGGRVGALPVGAPLLRVHAEGEDIPSGFRYCTTEPPARPED